MKTIFITISRGGIIRNIFRTGVVAKLLEADVRVVVLTPYHDQSEVFEDFKHPNLIIEPLFWKQQERWRGFLTELLKGAVFNSTVHARYRYSIGTPQKPKRILYPFRMALFAPLRIIPGAKRIIRFLYASVNPLRAHDYLFLKYKPDLVFNTASSADCGVLRSAKRFGVWSVDMPKSWDNPSQALFKTKANHLFVWSSFMKEQAIRLQGYREHEVSMTGIPQFDFYTQKDMLFSRKEFCEKHGFDSKKKIILYGSAGGFFCEEAKYVALLKKYIDSGMFADAQILVRPHLGYKGDAERFSSVEGMPGIVVDKSDRQNYLLRDNYDTSKGHIYNLFNSLYHADVCINAASTLSLDAMACGTPVININFDIEKAGATGDSIRRLYGDDYLKELMAMESTWLVNSEDEFLHSLKNVLEKDGRKDTQKTIDRFIYKLDGKSAERIAEALLEILSTKS